MRRTATTTTTTHPQRVRARRRAAGALLASALVGCGTLLGTATAVAGPPAPPPIPGPATTTLPGTLLEGGATDAGRTTLFAYAAAGDEVVARIATTGRSPAGARVVVTDPSGVVVHDDAAPAAIAGTHLGGAWTASADGVWSIAVLDASPSSGGEASLAWDVGVVRGGASIPGRVWTESLAVYTPEPTTIDVHAAAPDGAVYRVTLDDYDGVDSTLRMNDVGNAPVGTCEPAFRSVPMPHSPEAEGLGADHWQPSGADCAGLSAYRLFLEAPAADLPASTTAWADARTDDTWLSATYASPTISSLAFARDGAATNAGVLTGDLVGQPGLVRVEVDADGDGAYDGAADVVDEVAVLDPGPFAWSWDGLDARGSRVPVVASGIGLRASMAQVSPVHFLRIDAEESAGGIEVQALRGPAPGPATLHWDDTQLLASSDARSSRTPALIGSDPASTSAGGVHGWEPGSGQPNRNDGVHGSWGDMRAIDDWAFVEDHAEATVALAPLADLRIDKRVDAEVLVADDGSAVSVRWTLEVANLGPVPAAQATVVDAYPAELDVASVVADAPSQGAFDAATGTWSVGDLAPGARATLTLQGTVATTPGTRAAVVNSATVSSPEAPLVPGGCEPNEGVEADADRCDVVETPLEPGAAVPTTSPEPASPASATTGPAPVAQTPPTATGTGGATEARNPAAGPTLPRTGGDGPAIAMLAAAAAALLTGGAVLAWRRRARRQ
ncbi:MULTISPECIES: LPXTG cell wall anchor domain-containing protein [unclassified Agrococcus]|uniref:LPXTG cell wall anchor domain-containing protein n=1 Tax=unclassified Agrococcus TaxID=2615065 RepID=UPI003611D805